ncbi:MAG: glycosyltransferase family 2 protein [Alphaproteobacteria bacterium]|nr:glycosyltransferase family 2 protein [Alphaproteobacteria bacterium]MCW5744204.1 glycosyltransferase family 2 protein [Alphaproteobacteria bacterium]
MAASDISISIVVPTHDRLNLVKEAVSTVIRQGAGSWELIVFDNCSTEPLGNFVQSLAHPNVRFARSDTFLDVTASWNRAFNMATGDYIMLIGDDDGLAPGFFDKVRALVTEHDWPDMLYFPILQFFHPGVAPWRREGYVAHVRSEALGTDSKPHYLDRSQKREAVAGSFGMRRRFLFNMQGLIFRRSSADRMKVNGDFFQSPFPDYYIANAAMLLLDKVLVCPVAVAIAGVSKASFGFTLFNNEEARGAAMLKTENRADPFWQDMEPIVLPGPAYNTNYIITMRHLQERLGAAWDMKPDFKRYRRMQIAALVDARLPLREVILTPNERLFALAVKGMKKVRNLWPFNRILHHIQHPLAAPPKVTELAVGGIGSAVELFEMLQPAPGTDDAGWAVVPRGAK